MGKFNLFNDGHFLSLLDQLRCPIVIARQFSLPGVHRVKAWFLKLIRNRAWNDICLYDNWSLYDCSPITLLFHPFQQYSDS